MFSPSRIWENVGRFGELDNVKYGNNNTSEIKNSNEAKDKIIEFDTIKDNSTSHKHQKYTIIKRDSRSGSRDKYEISLKKIEERISSLVPYWKTSKSSSNLKDPRNSAKNTLNKFMKIKNELRKTDTNLKFWDSNNIACYNTSI